MTKLKTTTTTRLNAILEAFYKRGFITATPLIEKNRAIINFGLYKVVVILSPSGAHAELFEKSGKLLTHIKSYPLMDENILVMRIVDTVHTNNQVKQMERKTR